MKKGILATKFLRLGLVLTLTLLAGVSMAKAQAPTVFGIGDPASGEGLRMVLHGRTLRIDAAEPGAVRVLDALGRTLYSGATPGARRPRPHTLFGRHPRHGAAARGGRLPGAPPRRQGAQGGGHAVGGR